MPEDARTEPTARYSLSLLERQGVREARGGQADHEVLADLVHRYGLEGRADLKLLARRWTQEVPEFQTFPLLPESPNDQERPSALQPQTYPAVRRLREQTDREAQRLQAAPAFPGSRS